MDNKKYIIAKEFNFSYGHRVWAQELNKEFSIDDNCSCRFMHGHNAKVIVHLESNKLNAQGMVVDFRMIDWFKKYLDDTLDHKMILDIDDPLLEMFLEKKDKECIESTTDYINIFINDLLSEKNIDIKKEIILEFVKENCSLVTLEKDSFMPDYSFLKDEFEEDKDLLTKAELRYKEYLSTSTKFHENYIQKLCNFKATNEVHEFIFSEDFPAIDVKEEQLSCFIKKTKYKDVNYNGNYYTIDKDFDIHQINDPIFPKYKNESLKEQKELMDKWEAQVLINTELRDSMKEFFEGIVLVPFIPTSENFCKWIYDIVQEKMDIIGVKVNRIQFFETPKSESNYYG